MDEKKRGVNVSLDHSEPAFFTDNATVSHSSNKFVIDFSQTTPRFDTFESKQQQTFVIKHKTIVLDPQFAKIFSDILQQNIKRYEKNFGNIKITKEKKTKEKTEHTETESSKYIGWCNLDKNFIKKLQESTSISDIFEFVKEAVRKTINKSRAGLELGLAELGNAPQGFVGAYYIAGSNIIIMNETPLNRIQETNPKLTTPYIFSVLLHEYIHSLGYLDEETARQLSYEISYKIFGKENIITEISRDMRKFFPNFIYPEGAPPRIDKPVKLVKDFDKSSIRYIG